METGGMGGRTRQSKQLTHPQCHHAQPHPTLSSALATLSPQPQQIRRAWTSEKHARQKIGAIDDASCVEASDNVGDGFSASFEVIGRSAFNETTSLDE